MSDTPILSITPLGFPWHAADPFLACVHHEDFYPHGNAQLGPEASLAGRQIGQDFTIKDGWRMYHGQAVPGFPAHPHRGFETVTIVRRGVVDHSDSLGAAGRYGAGDVQWLTTGRGVQHAEMFPLLQQDKNNPMELFQIWLNLPASAKMAPPHFKMLWRESIPVYHHEDEDGHGIEVEIIAGELEGLQAPAPTPDSWAATPEHQLAIWHIHLAPHARWTLPATVAGINRNLYFYKGQQVSVGGESVGVNHGIALQPDQAVVLENGTEEAWLLLLQGQPINETVAQYGPFVMNSDAEVQQAFADYHRDQFGGWPWSSPEPTHGDKGRFARHADGKTETPEMK